MKRTYTTPHLHFVAVSPSRLLAGTDPATVDFGIQDGSGKTGSDFNARQSADDIASDWQ